MPAIAGSTEFTLPARRGLPSFRQAIVHRLPGGAAEGDSPWRSLSIEKVMPHSCLTARQVKRLAHRQRQTTQMGRGRTSQPAKRSLMRAEDQRRMQRAQRRACARAQAGREARQRTRRLCWRRLIWRRAQKMRTKMPCTYRRPFDLLGRGALGLRRGPKRQLSRSSNPLLGRQVQRASE